MHRLAVSSRFFASHDMHHVVHHLCNLGYEGLEYDPVAPHPTPEDLATEEARTAFRKLVTSHGLAFAALVGADAPLAHSLGAPTLIVESAERFTALAQSAPNVALAWRFTPAHRPGEIMEVLRSVPDRFGLAYNTAYALQIASDDLEFLKMVRERIVHIELADLGGPLGKGKVAFDRLIPELKNVAAHVWTSLDLTGSEDPFTAAADVKRLVEKWRRRYT